MPINRHSDSEIPAEHADHGLGLRPAKSKLRRWGTFVLSLVLLGGAGYFVYAATDGFDQLWDSVRSAPWWMIVLIVISPMGNHISVALCLQALQSRHGKVGIREMFVLVGSAWLLNYMPMRPGLFGRIGYHKAINKIRLRDSIESSIWSGVLAGIANGLMVVVALLMVRFDSWWSIALPAVPVALMFMLSPMMPGKRSRLMMRALAYRQIDVIVWLGRYWLVFTVLGLDMSLGNIALVSAVSQLTSLFPLTGSGLGFREWGVGLTASVSGYALDTALTGDLINRAAETMIVFPVGLICTAIVARHWKGMHAVHHANRSALLAEDDSRAETQQDHEPGDAPEQDPVEG